MVGYELTYELQGNNNLKELLDNIIHKTKIFGETFATIVQAKPLAEESGVSVRTINRYLKTLEEQGFIRTSTKRGNNGGTVITLNSERVKIKDHPDNPITGTTKTAEEIRKKYLPGKEPYKKKTNREYRSKRQIAEDRLLQTEKEREMERLNDILSKQLTPDREFFEQTDDPELNYKAWLLSRMYNGFLVEYPRIWMNKFEAQKNKEAFDWADKLYGKYRHYEILRDERFMGTQNFEHFKKLSIMIDEKGYNPLEYLESQFRYFFYLVGMGTPAKPPYVNTLWGEQAEHRHVHNQDWKKDFDREHPYFKKRGDIVSRVDSRILMLMDWEYSKGFYNDTDIYGDYIETKFQDQPMEFYENRIVEYYRTAMEKIEESDISDEAKYHTSEWVKQAVAINMSRESVSPFIYLLSSYRQVDMLFNNVKRETDNIRKAYFQVGNYSGAEQTSPRENRTFIEKGYHTHWAVKGHESFYNTLYTISKVRKTFVNWIIIRESLDKIDFEFPVGELGQLDIKPYIREQMPDFEKEIEARHLEMQVEMSKHDFEEIKDKEWIENLDADGEYWFNIMEPVAGMSQRDGTKIVENDSLNHNKGKDLVEIVLG